MLNYVIKFITFIIGLFGIFNGKKSKEEQLLKEDKELADAIKRGDSETVSKIRERRKRYPNLCIVLILLFFAVGCSSMKYRDVPLSQGTIPYQIPSGIYVDTKGIAHNEANPRWSISEEDLFNNTRQIQPEKKNNFTEHFNKYWMYYVMAVLVTCILHYGMKKNS